MLRSISKNHHRLKRNYSSTRMRIKLPFIPRLQKLLTVSPMKSALADLDSTRFTFNEEFDRDAAKLFYGVGDTTIGMTHSFWAGGLITVTGKNTHEAFKTYLSRGLQNTSNLPDDHLAVELAFLGHLLAEDKIDEAQQFVKNEILAWWPTAEQNIDSKTQNAGIKAFFASVTTALKFVEAL